MKRESLSSIFNCALIAIAMTMAWSGPAHAYIGPGLGLGSLAVIFGVFASIIIAIFASVWYPIKRIIKKRRSSADASATAATGAEETVDQPEEATAENDPVAN